MSDNILACLARYVNQHKKCQITFWPASVAGQDTSLMICDHIGRHSVVDCCFPFSFVNLLLICWLFVVSIVYALVHDNIPLESVRNYAVCKSLHFNYPQRCILPQNETKYTCERLCILPQIVTNYMYTDVCTHRLFIPQVQPK